MTTAAVALGQRTQRDRERLGAQRVLDLLVGQRALARDEVAEHGVVRLADRRIERCRGARSRAHLLGLLERQVRLVGDLLERRLAAELGPEVPLGAIHLLQALDDVDRHADRPRLVGESARDGLADPPGRVGRELVAAAPVELLDRADQAEGAFLDQVEERQALVAVVLRDRDDEPQVRLDHPLLGPLVAALDLLRELDLLRRGQQRMAAGLAQEELQASVVVSHVICSGWLGHGRGSSGREPRRPRRGR